MGISPSSPPPSPDRPVPNTTSATTTTIPSSTTGSPSHPTYSSGPSCLSTRNVTPDLPEPNSAVTTSSAVGDRHPTRSFIPTNNEPSPSSSSTTTTSAPSPTTTTSSTLLGLRVDGDIEYVPNTPFGTTETPTAATTTITNTNASVNQDSKQCKSVDEDADGQYEGYKEPTILQTRTRARSLTAETTPQTTTGATMDRNNTSNPFQSVNDRRNKMGSSSVELSQQRHQPQQHSQQQQQHGVGLTGGAPTPNAAVAHFQVHPLPQNQHHANKAGNNNNSGSGSGNLGLSASTAQATVNTSNDNPHQHSAAGVVPSVSVPTPLSAVPPRGLASTNWRASPHHHQQEIEDSMMVGAAAAPSRGGTSGNRGGNNKNNSSGGPGAGITATATSNAHARTPTAAAMGNMYSPFDPTGSGAGAGTGPARSFPQSAASASTGNSGVPPGPVAAAFPASATNMTAISSPGPAASAAIAATGAEIQIDAAILDASYSYCFDRGNGQYAPLIPTDALTSTPYMRDIKALQHGCAGMLVLPVPRGNPPSGGSGGGRAQGCVGGFEGLGGFRFLQSPPTTPTSPSDTIQSRIDNIVASTPPTPTMLQQPTMTHSQQQHHASVLPASNDSNMGTGMSNPTQHAHHHPAPNHQHHHHHHPNQRHQQQQHPQRRPKIYCDKWVHEGVCAFTQQGCKYKHEMPFDKFTQHQLGLFHGYPAWWKKHQAELARQRDVAPPPPQDQDRDRGQMQEGSAAGGDCDDDAGRVGSGGANAGASDRFLGRGYGLGPAQNMGLGVMRGSGDAVRGTDTPGDAGNGGSGPGGGPALLGSSRHNPSAVGFTWRRGPTSLHSPDNSNGGGGIDVGIGIGEHHHNEPQAGSLSTSASSRSGTLGHRGGLGTAVRNSNPIAPASYGSSPFGPIAPPTRTSGTGTANAASTAAMRRGAVALNATHPMTGPIANSNPYASLEALDENESAASSGGGGDEENEKAGNGNSNGTGTASSGDDDGHGRKSRAGAINTRLPLN